GISGGLDSTQALLAGVKALDILGYPRTNMIAVTMPCFGTTTRTKSNAQHISELCGTDFREISIRESVVQHLKDIGHDGVTADVAFENAQARERTQVLMDLANMENAIVLGTGDMSEAALGWCTYNGDHMSMYNVNCNMTKTFLRKVVRYEAEHCENIELSKVLLDVIDTPVSPELKPSEKDNISQKTEDILGPYEVLDYYLERFVKYHQSPTAIFELAQKVFAEKYDIEDLKKWLNQFIKRFFNNQFKRNCVPDGPRVIDYDLSPSSGWIMTSDTSNASFLNLV
ncbi:MAG: NAD(+) synthase, partial [Oscillospiraceae bacterium]|nr:NAD(+) synthase [Oscillospiraceae bacterium]